MIETTMFFRDLAYIFVAAVAGGLVARRLGQPLILGYVFGGILISPFTPGPSVSDLHTLELFAEVGVVLLMFSIGIEFSIRDLVRVKWVALFGGPLGIGAMVLLGYAVLVPLGWSPTEAMVVGAVVSVASTMVLAKFLLERGELRSLHGRIMIGITLVEDLAVVFLTVLLPSLSSLDRFISTDFAWALARAVLIMVPLAYGATKLMPPFLARVARLHSQELFLLVILALCLGTAAVTKAVGLSLALGAFLAGALLSGSEYAREALGQLFPLRDAFVALFFVTIGMLMNPAALASNLGLLIAIVGLIVLGKLVVWAAVVKLFGYSLWTGLMVAIGLTQIGEFSYVLVQVARQANLVGDDIYNATLAASLVTILINSILIRKGSGWLSRVRLSRELKRGPEPATEDLHNHVVICGFGRLGGPAGTAFDAFDVPYVIIDIDPDVVAAARRQGVRCILGEPVYRSVLEAAQVGTARLVLVTVPETDRAFLAIRHVKALNPRVPIIARAHRRAEREALLKAGASHVVQPETEASASMISEALGLLDVSSAKRASYIASYREAMELAQAEPVASVPPLPQLQEVSADELGVAGLSLRESGLREQFGLTVISIRRGEEQPMFNPDPFTVLQPGDVLQVLGLPEKMAQLPHPK